MTWLGPKVKASVFIWGIANLALLGCERVQAPDDLNLPPPRLQPAKRVESLPQNDIPEPETTPRYLHHGKESSYQSFKPVQTLPHLTPPRLILRDSQNYELVAKLGERLGREGAIISAMDKDSITLEVLEWRLNSKAEVQMIELKTEGKAPGIWQSINPLGGSDRVPKGDKIPFP